MIESSTKSQFTLGGFSQTAGIRIYKFEGMVDAHRVSYAVKVDLALIPVHGIRIQDLPLLCRDLLQRNIEPDETGAIVFTEQEMRTHAQKLATAREEAQQRKKPPRHIVSANTGAGWRTTPIR